MENVLVIGGCGYIGSHVVKGLICEGKNVLVFDNLEKGYIQALKVIENQTNKKIEFFKGDIRNKQDLEECFRKFDINSVIHFAAYKEAGKSVTEIEKYFLNNVIGLINVIETMIKFKVSKLIFSSSASVYGTQEKNPIDENSPTNPDNPYGETKLIGEMILKDYCKIKKISAIALRYFNVCGADKSGDIGEDPKVSLNLIPKIVKVYTGKEQVLNVFGDDYPTKDGTGIRDYIHVLDLADGHLKALEYLNKNDGFEVFNLGTSQGYSVLEVIKEFETQSKKKINYTITSRRAGDPAEVFGDANKAKRLLAWVAKNNLKDIIKDTLNWTKKHPTGYNPY